MRDYAAWHQSRPQREHLVAVQQVLFIFQILLKERYSQLAFLSQLGKIKGSKELPTHHSHSPMWDREKYPSAHSWRTGKLK
jgi:hypothetical protein